MKKYSLRLPATGKKNYLQYVDLKSGKRCLQQYYEYATKDEEIHMDHLAVFLRQMQRIENGPKVACEIVQSNMFGDHTNNTHKKYFNFLGAVIDSQVEGSDEFRAQIAEVIIPELLTTLATDPIKYPYPGREIEIEFMKKFCGFILENNHWVRCVRPEGQPLMRQAFSRLVEIPPTSIQSKPWDILPNSNFPLKKRKIRQSRAATPSPEKEVEAKLPKIVAGKGKKSHAIGKCEACSVGCDVIEK